MSRQLTIEEVYRIIDQVEDEPTRNLLRIAYGQLRAEYEFDREWKEANLPDLIRLDKRVKDLEAALKIMIDTQDDWEKGVSEVVGRQPDVFNRAIDAARKVLGEKWGEK